ncbi:GTP-binding protein engB [Emticicia oligotrophica DSM 17448]|uniref:Probable GTP-binding protein EngB n=1 Tax=Emticicia oligotrophica (strain DSM 17448 / CIP 109782 / MTCC 6937 / GPTSA100-15) TaxID=929562 RepID=A0ABN4ALB8_EMTOG|nr:MULTISPECIES: ribosome biogenesis GTP-binding protein YihA/YsxC [Emticicia]AFK02833.1 GTP-binding protein engB [Emticicia oligotrophica DSM 17448]
MKTPKLIEAKFVTSAADYRKCPPPTKPEYAFIGRSNVGKSSLINMLAGNKNLAKTSQVPGKTQLINHFEINKKYYIVDLPGYGFAKAPKNEREKWGDMIGNYLANRESLVCVFVLIDIRHEPQRVDLEFLDFLGERDVPFCLIFTKADKVGGLTAEKNVELFKKTMLLSWTKIPQYFITSSERRLGRDEILQAIEEMNLSFTK